MCCPGKNHGSMRYSKGPHKIKAMTQEVKKPGTTKQRQVAQREGGHKLFSKQHGAGLKYQGIKTEEKEMRPKK